MLLVLDIGGTQIKYAYMDQQGKIIFQSSLSTSLINSKDSFYQTILSLLNQDTEGIAISMPGIIDSKAGKIKIVSVFPYLNNCHITDELSKLSHLKVSVENDAKCAALCEAKIGNAKNVQDAIIIVFGTGIGGSIIKDGHIHHGTHLLSGEVSTIIVDDQGTEWSDLCSTKNLCKTIADIKGLESIDGKEIYRLIRNNDQDIISTINTYYRHIAIQLYNFQYIYDPAIILLGGGISKEPLFIQGVQKAIDDLSANKIIIPKIETCAFYNDANLYGAYYHYFE